MSVILIGNTKGGIGKSTGAVQFAAGRALQGKDVLFVNGDRQLSSSNSIRRRDEANMMPSLTLAEFSDGDLLRTHVLRQASKYDDIIIDAGGRDSTALRHSMMIADVMLVPIAPKDYELDSLVDELAPLIDEIQAARGDNPLPVYAYLNMAEPKKYSQDNVAARKAIAAVPQLTLLPYELVDRKSFSSASARGLSVKEWKPRDLKAVKEIDALLNALF